MPHINLNWHRFQFRPPHVWWQVRKHALTEMDSKVFEKSKRSVYVVRIAHTYLIEYANGASPVLYIGSGNLKTRFSNHLQNWINDLSNLVRDLEVEVFFCNPRVRNTKEAYKTVEADLIEFFVEDVKSVPMYNRNRPWPIYQYTYWTDQVNKVISIGSGKRYLWSLKPKRAVGSAYETFCTNYQAPPRHLRK